MPKKHNIYIRTTISVETLAPLIRKRKTLLKCPNPRTASTFIRECLEHYSELLSLIGELPPDYFDRPLSEDIALLQKLQFLTKQNIERLKQQTSEINDYIKPPNVEKENFEHKIEKSRIIQHLVDDYYETELTPEKSIISDEEWEKARKPKKEKKSESELNKALSELPFISDKEDD